MPAVTINARTSTIAATADAIVVGGTLGGLVAACELAEQGRNTMLLEAGPVLGTEVSAQWLNTLPQSRIFEQVLEECRSHGAARERRIDLVAAAAGFDRIASGHGVSCIVRAMATRPLADADQRLIGVEIVGKSGRQAVLAPLVIDATAARRFSGKVLELPEPKIKDITARMYLHGLTVPAKGKDIALPPQLAVKDNTLRLAPAVWENEVIAAFSIIPQSTRPTAAEVQSTIIESAVRIITFLRAEPDYTHLSLVGISPEPGYGFQKESREHSRLNRTGLVVLPTAADLQQELDAVRDTISNALTAANDQPLPGQVEPRSTANLQSSELEADPAWDQEQFTLPPIQARMHEPADVVVAGYGTGGAFAAITAAQEGASVAALDPAPLPGGISTAGNIHSYYHGVRVGLQTRLDELTAGVGSNIADRIGGFHPLAKAAVLIRTMHEHHVNLLPGHVVFGAIRENGRVTGILTAADDGYHVFPCSTAIDATGDADLATAAGAGFTLGREGDGFPQPYSYTPTQIKDNQLGHHNFDAGWVDPTDTLDFSRAHFQARKEIWRMGPFSNEKHYCTLASVLGLRESRFVKGPVRLTFDDFMQGRTWDDAVCEAKAHYDNHAMDYAQESDWALRHVVMCGMWRQLARGRVPFRALYPEGLDNVLIACRAISVDHDLHQLLRMQPDLQTIGEVCGLAAAMLTRTGEAVSALAIKDLQARLRERGILPAEQPTPLMSESTEQLLAALGTEENGPAMWRISLLAPEAAPDWEAFFAEETEPGRRFAAAVAGALAGSRTNVVVSELEHAANGRISEPPLGVKSPPPYVVAAMALAAIAPDTAVKAIAGLLAQEDVNPQEAMLLFRALADNRIHAGIAVIREFIARTRDRHFTTRLWGKREGDSDTDITFAVELAAIRALQNLGCFDESHRLDQYTRDPNLLIRRYARRLKAEAG